MKTFIKRNFDLIVSIVSIFILFPFWLIIAVVIKLESKGPILYKHTRVGLNGEEFQCLKFRSMYVNSDPNTLVSSPNDSRVTKIGHFLRVTSLDETTQLINVLFGQMSIVGPRPALPSQVLEFSKNDHDKLLVKPGLTGWTQVNGRNSISYEKRMELDCWYAKNWSLLLDLKILIKTPFVIFNVMSIYDR
jgi:lipopolysaccharide/colanic/teichoic acid biosynthesis glycosyltransferase